MGKVELLASSQGLNSKTRHSSPYPGAELTQVQFEGCAKGCNNLVDSRCSETHGERISMDK